MRAYSQKILGRTLTHAYLLIWDVWINVHRVCALNVIRTFGGALFKVRQVTCANICRKSQEYFLEYDRWPVCIWDPGELRRYGVLISSSTDFFILLEKITCCILIWNSKKKSRVIDLLRPLKGSHFRPHLFLHILYRKHKGKWRFFEDSWQ